MCCMESAAVKCLFKVPQVDLTAPFACRRRVITITVNCDVGLIAGSLGVAAWVFVKIASYYFCKKDLESGHAKWTVLSSSVHARALDSGFVQDFIQFAKT